VREIRRRRVRARRRGAASLAGLLLAAGCAGPGFDYADLPDAPIAFVYRTPEESERVHEWIERRAARQEPSLPGQKTVRLEDVGEFLGLGPGEEGRAAGILGRIAFLDPASREIEVAGFAKRGARPMAWSADGQRLLYVDVHRGDPHVLEWSRETGEIRLVTHGDFEQVDACYGPDGRVAFSRTEGDRTRIWVREPGGGPPHPVTSGPRDFEPAWAPDGSLLAYRTHDAQRGEQIATIAPDEGGAPQMLGRGRAPTFTPEGAWIVYSRPTRAGWRLYRMHPDGSGRRPLGGSPHDENDPAVSPDGRFVAFVSTQLDRQVLVVRSIASGGDLPLLLDGEGLLPVW
jgi:dipeptidyl aminopeptidase/acylaminoacyl peptidase